MAASLPQARPTATTRHGTRRAPRRSLPEAPAHDLALRAVARRTGADEGSPRSLGVTRDKLARALDWPIADASPHPERQRLVPSWRLRLTCTRIRGRESVASSRAGFALTPRATRRATGPAAPGSKAGRRRSFAQAARRPARAASSESWSCRRASRGRARSPTSIRRIRQAESLRSTKATVDEPIEI
jgi:hypothetical protein